MSEENYTNENIVRSVSSDQHEIIRWIIRLHTGGGSFHLDPTYSSGNFYSPPDIPEPLIKSDLLPRDASIIEADCTNLDFIESAKITSIMFDPPFITGAKNKGSIIKGRFSYLKNNYSLWEFYHASLVELYRVLAPGGILCFKCQDQVEGGKNFMNHVWIMNDAVSIGFYPKDLFILLASNRILRSGKYEQQHARKFHSYFWVFEKRHSRVSYDFKVQ